ncbi:MAG: DNA translocase FtsK [Pseudomonadota bacterium]
MSLVAPTRAPSGEKTRAKDRRGRKGRAQEEAGTAAAARRAEAPATPGVLPAGTGGWARRRLGDLFSLVLIALIGAIGALLYTYSPQDPSLNAAGAGPISNVFGKYGAWLADIIMQTLGVAAYLAPAVLLGWLWRSLRRQPLTPFWLRAAALPAGLFFVCIAVDPLEPWASWPLDSGLGGAAGFLLNRKLGEAVGLDPTLLAMIAVLPALLLLVFASGLRWREVALLFGWPLGLFGLFGNEKRRAQRLETPAEPEGLSVAAQRKEPEVVEEESWAGPSDHEEPAPAPSGGRLKIELPPAMAAAQAAERSRLAEAEVPEVVTPPDLPNLREAKRRGLLARLVSRRDGPPEPKPEKERAPKAGRTKVARMEPTLRRENEPSEVALPEEEPIFSGRIEPEEAPPPPMPPMPAPPMPAKAAAPKPAPQPELDLRQQGEYQPPGIDFLKRSDPGAGPSLESQDALEKNARLLEGVLQDFGVRGEIVTVRPGPVVTRYELEPAPGTKTSRVIGLADDIARSMSALSVRVAVVPGSSVIGIELPNARRQTVFLSDILTDPAYKDSSHKLALVLGKDIGGAPQVVDLARMPHLLVAGTTGSGKSVAINAMIMSLLYRLSPEECRLIMVDPKMLELSVYDDIPHLLSPVVTDPKKAVVALKWAVREMEDRYRAMSHLGVRNIDGYNQRLAQALEKGEVLTRRVQTGFDPDTGEPVIEQQPLDLKPLPYIVIIVDEMADLMLVAGKEIEGAVQRLAQMARAAGLHLIMATQRPSVDVITGTIKANFPTRISFHVTSKIDSRTILGEMGAEQLLGQGDMLYMAAGGRIQRVHGPFVADQEVEKVVAHLRSLGPSHYVTDVTEEPEELGGAAAGGLAGDEEGDQLYRQAVELVIQHKKASTSFVQRHLQIGYNRAARLVERMENEGIVSPANHVGKREVYGGE